jgi:hypothetical protein
MRLTLAQTLRNRIGASIPSQSATPAHEPDDPSGAAALAATAPR